MTQSHQSDPLASFSAMLRVALGELLDPSATRFVEMMAEDAVMEFPYAPPGLVQRLEGRAALTEHLRGLVGMLEIERMTEPTIHRTKEPGVVVLEFGCIGRGVKTDQPYNQQYISVITLRDGHIVHYRDYWNPLVVIAAVGGSAAITAALSGGGH